MNDLLNVSLFDPIVPLIRCFDPGRQYLEIEIPKGLSVDVDEVLKYFESDATLIYGEIQTKLTGSLKSKELFSYLMSQYCTLGPKFFYQFKTS